MKLTKVEQESDAERADRLQRTAPPRPEWRSPSNLGCLGLIVVWVAAMLYVGSAVWSDFQSGRAGRRQAREAQAKVEADRAAGVLSAQDPIDIELACEAAVKDQLKAPATARLIKNAGAAWTGSAWNYAGVVDAQNSFGVLLRSRFTCVVAGTTKQNATIAVDVQ